LDLKPVLVKPIDEETIICEVNSGNINAFADIVRVYQGKVLGLCRSLLGDATQAEDAAQEIFLKAYQSLSTFRRDSSFSTWLYRISANHCKDLLRKRTRQKTESLEALTDQMGDAVERLFKAPAQAEVSAENAECMEKILSQLSPHERLILTLREAEGLSYQEIAETLECTVDAVKARLRRAREALNEKLRHFSKGSSV
jgi:RNA polymerase sigma-70 factor (ECF subfamily)